MSKAALLGIEGQMSTAVQLENTAHGYFCLENMERACNEILEFTQQLDLAKLRRADPVALHTNLQMEVRAHGLPRHHCELVPLGSVAISDLGAEGLDTSSRGRRRSALRVLSVSAQASRHPERVHTLSPNTDTPSMSIPRTPEES